MLVLINTIFTGIVPSSLIEARLHKARQWSSGLIYIFLIFCRGTVTIWVYLLAQSPACFIDQNRIMWLSEDVGQNIGQGQSTAQNLILSIFCIPSSVTGIPLGTCALSIWKLRALSSIIQAHWALEYWHISVLKMSWIMINQFTRKCFHRTRDVEPRCGVHWMCGL